MMLRRWLGSLLVLSTGMTCGACGSDGSSGGGGAAGADVTVPGVGTINGAKTSTMRSYKGIPYAAPPVGPLRWKPPQKAAPLAAPLDATKFGSGCAQPKGFFGTDSASEDCLFLNVYAPAGPGPYPVMFWIHGGAFLAGESTEYDPTKLVAEGVIVVTINYRLGMLGFLAHPAIDNGAGMASTNFGLLDQQLALHWVQDNIGSFGGDKNNVTIFGESAGGFSVHSQLVMPGAHGLFQKAIVESGAYGNTLQPTLDTAQMQGASFATAAHCPTPCTADFLRGVSTADVLAAQGSLNLQTVLPAVDGTVIPMGGVGGALTMGTYEKVPMIEGSNHDEWALFVALYMLQTNAMMATQADYEAAAAATFGVSTAIADSLIGQYPLSSYMGDPAAALTAAGTDFVFSCPSRVAATSLSANAPTYAYEFSDENAPELFLPVPTVDPSFKFGAAHASEIQFLWSTAPTMAGAVGSYGGPLSADEQALSATMVKYWAQFAKAGDPNIAGAPTWPAYTAATDTMLTFATPATSVAATTAFKTAHKCQ
ncbi:MAG TPA: carboxylesterase family protein [Polyangiaceae bacterium]|jgi:para-nitrobenzyl esterase|nr:carboxylesterase family protein [Polyangiaceae bacterium]